MVPVCKFLTGETNTNTAHNLNVINAQTEDCREDCGRRQRHVYRKQEGQVQGGISDGYRRFPGEAAVS